MPRPPWALPWVLKRDGTSGGTEVHFVPFADPAIGKIDLDRGTLTLDPRILAEDDED